MPRKVSPEHAGERLDVWLVRQFPEYSRAFLQKWVRAGRVTVQGKPATPSDEVRAGDMIDVVDFAAGSEQAPVAAEPRVAVSLNVEPGVLFEDAALLVLDKPAGLVVHPAPSYRGATLVDWLGHHLGGKVTKQFTDPERLGLVHRLDKDTSGVLMIAKSVPAQVSLAKQFRDRTVRKTYAAWVHGMPTSPTGVISAPVGRSRKDPTRMAVTGSGRASETSFEIEESLREVALLNLHPKTGRTHQIRVHTAAMGHPIVGDVTYGADPAFAARCGVRRPLLHAEQLEVTHPTTRKAMVFKAPRPADFKTARTAFRKWAAQAAVIMICVGMTIMAHAVESTSEEAKPVHHKTTSTSSSSSSQVRLMRKEVASMKDQMEAMQASVSSLNDQVAAINAGLGQLDAARRLRDLERALPDVNAKMANATTNAEEARSQAMDAARKMKDIQQSIDQFRDQLDKIQRQLIEARAKSEESALQQTPPPANAAAAKNP